MPMAEAEIAAGKADFERLAMQVLAEEIDRVVLANVR